MAQLIYPGDVQRGVAHEIVILKTRGCLPHEIVVVRRRRRVTHSGWWSIVYNDQ
jgi:hypothetical protein